MKNNGSDMMGFFNFLDNIKTDEEKRKKEELEKKMKNLNLEEWEKDEIRKDNYDITSFEDDNENDVEDDDYYEE